MAEHKHHELTGEIVSSAHKVHNAIGYGYDGRVYYKAMQLELAARDLDFESDKLIEISYEGSVVGDFTADLIFGDKVLVEVIADEDYNKKLDVQLRSHMRAIGVDVGMILNFGPSLQIRRLAQRPPKPTREERAAAAEDTENESEEHRSDSVSDSEEFQEYGM